MNFSLAWAYFDWRLTNLFSNLTIKVNIFILKHIKYVMDNKQTKKHKTIIILDVVIYNQNVLYFLTLSFHYLPRIFIIDISTNINYLCLTKLCTKYFTGIISYNSYSNPMSLVLISQLYKEGNKRQKSCIAYPRANQDCIIVFIS